MKDLKKYLNNKSQNCLNQRSKKCLNQGSKKSTLIEDLRKCLNQRSKKRYPNKRSKKVP